MKNFFFYLFRAYAWFIATMPFPVIYVMSDFLCMALRYVVRYRVDVVKENLELAFPEKDAKQIRKIMALYFRNLSDVILEVIKMEGMSTKEMTKRFRFENHALLQEALDNNRSVLVAIGHCGNWEWMGTALGLIMKQKGYALVKPLADKNFQHYMQGLRHRMNPDSTIPFKSAFRVMVKRRAMPTFYVIAADQTPTLGEATFWTTFLNRETPFFEGIEKISRSLDMEVIFIEVTKERRGHYLGTLSLIADEPGARPEGEITEKYIKTLESAIRQNPSNWLWSHRRWKHSPDHHQE